MLSVRWGLPQTAATRTTDSQSSPFDLALALPAPSPDPLPLLDSSLRADTHTQIKTRSIEINLLVIVHRTWSKGKIFLWQSFCFNTKCATRRTVEGSEEF